MVGLHMQRTLIMSSCCRSGMLVQHYVCHMWSRKCLTLLERCRRGRDGRMVGFSTTCAIGVYHYLSCEFGPRLWRGVLDTAIYDKVRQ